MLVCGVLFFGYFLLCVMLLDGDLIIDLINGYLLFEVEMVEMFELYVVCVVGVVDSVLCVLL